jgi:hypothetical protein
MIKLKSLISESGVYFKKGFIVTMNFQRGKEYLNALAKHYNLKITMQTTVKLLRNRIDWKVEGSYDGVANFIKKIQKDFS